MQGFTAHQVSSVVLLSPTLVMEHILNNSLELALLTAGSLGSLAYWQAKKQYKVNPNSDIERLKKKVSWLLRLGSL